ncbi:MAG TPA: rhomboid family intramembrane serine protease, partial [Acidimicrobiales bacterium]
GFLHYGILHIGFNMWALYVFGIALERGIGKARMGMVYGVALLAGSLGGLIATPNSFGAGASGAIFGLMGAIFVIQRANGIPLRHSPLLPVLLINLFITFTIPNISIGAHVGGLIGGAVAGWLLVDLSRRPDVPRLLPWVGCVLVGAGCFVASIAYANGYSG